MNNDECLLCGKKLNHEDNEKHHSIPKCLKPKNNVAFRIHKECHKIINGLYTSQQKKSTKTKLKNILEDAILKLTIMLERLEDERRI